MRIATWNLDRAKPRPGARLSALKEAMAEVAADIWVLTETWLSLSPGPEYALVAQSENASDRDAAEGEVWCAVWSRLPGAAVRLSAEPDRTAAAQLTRDDGSRVLVYGTVLPWGSDKRRSPMMGADAFVASLEAQSSEWGTLTSSHPEVPLVIVGDFNQDLALAHYYGSRRGAEALRAALVRHELQCLTGDERDPLLPVPHVASIDHICVPRPWSGQTGAWPAPEKFDRRISDHYGAWATVACP
jgi:endonuclease/exonuclease/phosphatase family metal-dependent hydrolase